MKHPLTSKERRGLAAVAAAALLCIGAGVMVRSCRPGGDVAPTEVAGSRGHLSDGAENRAGKAEKKKKSKTEKKSGRKKSRSAKKKAPKTYPERDPLSEPCDE